MWAWLDALLNNVWFYIAIIAFATYFYGTYKAFFGKIPLLGRLSKRLLFLIGIVGALFTMGVLGSWSTASIAGGAMAIKDLQVTTDFTTDVANSNGNVTEDSMVDDLINARFTDAMVVETAASEELYTGVIAVRRTGDLKAASCEVSVYLPNDNYPADAGNDGNVYSIVEKTSKGEPEVYLVGASSSTGATINSQKGFASVPFAEGIDTGYLGVAIEVDEEGHDALNIHNYRDVVLDFCGSEQFTFRIHRTD